MSAPDPVIGCRSLYSLIFLDEKGSIEIFILFQIGGRICFVSIVLLSSKVSLMINT